MLEVRQPTHKELFEIKYYLGLDDQNLHSLYKLYLKPETSGSIFTSGQAPHQNYESHLQQIICGQWHLCKRVNNPIICGYYSFNCSNCRYYYGIEFTFPRTCSPYCNHYCKSWFS